MGINAFINLFKYAQQFYGQKMKNEFSFSMFYSEPPFADLIFSDAAQKIIVLNETKRHYLSYLGPEFTKAFEEVECFSSSPISSISSFTTIFFLISAALIF